MTQQPNVGFAEKTAISDRLHKQALAWFEDHPGQQGFLRDYVPGEFSAQSLEEMQRSLGGQIVKVYVQFMGDHLAARVPLCEAMLSVTPANLAPSIDLTGYRVHHCSHDKPVR